MKTRFVLLATAICFRALAGQNLSVRNNVGTGDNLLITGFVVSGQTSAELLIRAAGNSLIQFGVPNALQNPVLSLYDSAGQQLARNADWTSNSNRDSIQRAAVSQGAYPYLASSKDAALLVRLPQGVYTAHLQSANGAPANGLLEFYAAAGLINMSVRCVVSSTEPTIVGYSLPGRRLLIRAIGPSLSQFGVSGILANPVIEIVRPEFALAVRGPLIPAVVAATNDDWGVQGAPARANVKTLGLAEEIRIAASQLAAFPLISGSRDAAMLVTTNENANLGYFGGLHIHVIGKGGSSGIALIEIWDAGPDG